MVHRISLTLLAGFSLTVSQAQRVDNVLFKNANPTEMEISYDLIPLERGQIFDIRLLFSADQGQSWDTLHALSGDIGQGIAAGQRKRIIWNMFSELDHLQQSIGFKVCAVAYMPDYADTKLVEGGSFKLGCTSEQQDCNPDEKPAHTVHVETFYMGQYEVSVAEFREFVTASGYKTTAEKNGYADFWNGSAWEERKGISWKHDALGDKHNGDEDKQPVLYTSWLDAVQYCNWKSQKEGRQPCYRIDNENVECDWTANGYRLPTEAEWEYAARGGKQSLGFPFAGSQQPSLVACCNINSAAAPKHRGSAQSNELGLYDMSGNVWEWCWDAYHPYAYGGAGNGLHANVHHSTLDRSRVLRGGSWSTAPKNCRVALRNHADPSKANNLNGFRVVFLP